MNFSEGIPNSWFRIQKELDGHGKSEHGWFGGTTILDQFIKHLHLQLWFSNILGLEPFQMKAAMSFGAATNLPILDGPLFHHEKNKQT